MRIEPPSVSFRKSVVRRDQQCMICTSTDNLHASRIDRNGPMTPENGRCLCYRCLKREHDRNRVPRSLGRPQRKTLLKQLNYLQRELAMAKGKPEPQPILDMPHAVRKPTSGSLTGEVRDYEKGQTTEDDVMAGADCAPMPEDLTAKQDVPPGMVPGQPMTPPEAAPEGAPTPDQIEAERIAYAEALQRGKQKEPTP